MCTARCLHVRGTVSPYVTLLLVGASEEPRCCRLNEPMIGLEDYGGDDWNRVQTKMVRPSPNWHDLCPFSRFGNSAVTSEADTMNQIPKLHQLHERHENIWWILIALIAGAGLLFFAGTVFGIL